MIIKFDVYNDGKFWCGRSFSEDIFTQGLTLDELVENIKEAVSLHFEELTQKGEELKIITISELEVPSIAKTTYC
jgi:predicted RNase H-like HicB family nuclease